jgi:hypothetical protein
MRASNLSIAVRLYGLSNPAFAMTIAMKGFCFSL